MGFRFRRRLKLFPGVSLNISKTGVSTSVGVPGATVNLRGDRTRTTVGLPGSGISYTTTENCALPSVSRPRTRWLLWLVLVVALFGIIALLNR